jgi:hypothetical protein
VILFLETGSLTTLLLHDVHFCLFLSSFVALYFGQTLCIYMGCTDIGYCIYDILWFLWMVLVFFYGYVFLAMCMDVCLWMCLGMCLGYVYGYRVSILREAWFNKYRGLPLLGARFHHHWDLLLHEAHFIIIGTYSFTGPISMTLRIFPIFLDKKWKNLPQYAVSNKFF